MRQRKEHSEADTIQLHQQYKTTSHLSSSCPVGKRSPFLMAMAPAMVAPPLQPPLLPLAPPLAAMAMAPMETLKTKTIGDGGDQHRHHQKEMYSHFRNVLGPSSSVSPSLSPSPSPMPSLSHSHSRALLSGQPLPSFCPSQASSQPCLH